MAVVNPIDWSGIHQSGLPSPDLDAQLAHVAQRLREITVQVRSRDGGGSGVIWSADGLIVTNAHVASQHEHGVVLGNGRKLVAHTIARDGSRDLALLQVDAAGLQPARVRAARTLRAGELVLAVGYPLGAVGAVAAGIVHSADAATWVQADLRLAPGNSGGPLADAEGCVVGINSMVAWGLALAVPSEAVASFVSAAGAPRLGVTVQPAIQGGQVVGMMIVEIVEDGAAAAAGLRVGDVIVAAEGRRLHSPQALARAIVDAGADARTSSEQAAMLNPQAGPNACPDRCGALSLDVAQAGIVHRVIVRLAPAMAV